ncbi:MAG: hypothetical protein PHU46_12195 [Rhodocyclaceae bacterium]|nr:hypothetical protein [Rhodocyclaceae bacterium]
MNRLLTLALFALVAILPGCAYAGVFTDYAENHLVDALFRGQSLGAPATMYVGLSTTACSDSSPGTEVSTSGTGYARVAITSALANWSGTQAAGSTTASSGTNATTSNNGALTFPTPTGNWGQVGWVVIYDAASLGNAWVCIALSAAKNINNGDAAPSFPAGTLQIQVDN